jgi:uncharacterized protein YbaA (DUF1428 family)
MSNTVGDISVDTLLISSPRGNLDLSSSFVAASIYESVFTPGTICDIVVLDSTDFVKTLKISGDETVYFKFKSYGGELASFVFHLNQIKDVQSVGAQKAKMYSFQCISKEIMHSKTNLIQKSYNVLCSEMIKDIHTNYLKSAKPLVDIEPTAIPQNILIPSHTPYQAITTIKRRSISRENKSSVYAYFETRENNQQVFKFLTFEKMFAANTVKTFQQSDAINTDIFNIIPDNNIIAYTVPNQISSINKIRYGGPRAVAQMNFTTQEEKKNIIDTTSNDPKMTQTFFNEFFDGVRNPPQSVIPVDISQRSVTKIGETTPTLQSYMASLIQNSMKLRVPGDTILAPGQTIDCKIPSRTALTSPVQDDSEMSGKFLITRIHHRIGMLVERPRYTCIIECIKVNYESNEA